jgi:hypothetical protein
MDSSASKNTTTRLNSYKHYGKDSNELRRQRNQYHVSLRKVFKFQSKTKKNDSFYLKIFF